MARLIPAPNTTLATSSPSSLSSNQNNWSPGNLSSSNQVRLTLTGNITLTGLDSTGIANGQEVELINTSSIYAASVTHQSSSSSVANRFTLSDGLDIIIRPYGSVLFRYDTTSATWRQSASAQLGRQATIIFLASANLSLTINDAQTEMSPVHRTHFDLTNYTQFYLDEGHTAGTHSGTKYGIQYSLDNGSSWVWLDGTSAASAPTAYADIGTAAQLNSAGWFTIHSPARTFVLLKAIFTDGGATAFTAMRNVRAQIR